MNKQTIMICMVLFLLIVPSVIAAPFDFLNNIRGGSTGFGAYDRHKDILDFGIFFILFLAVTWLSIRSFYSEKEQRNPALAIAIVVAIALAIAALKAGLSPSFAGPFMKYVLFFLGVVLLYLIFVKLFHVETAGGRILVFILALLLLWLLFNLANFSFERSRIDLPSGGGAWEKTKDFFRGLTKAPTRTISVEGEEEGEEVELEEKQKEGPSIADQASKKASDIWSSITGFFKKKCESDAECNGGSCKVSTDGKTKSCVECTSDTQCKDNKVCDLKENECVEGTQEKTEETKLEEEEKCTTNEDCSSDQYCDTATKICVVNTITKTGCTTDNECSDTETCDTATKTCVPIPAAPTKKECTTSRECPPEKPACNSGECMEGECGTELICLPEKPICIWENAEKTKTTCVQCIKNENCPSGSICDSKTSTCISSQPTQIKPEEIEGYTLYPTFDLRGPAIFTATSYAECASQCNGMDECAAFVWVRTDNKCYGKNTKIVRENIPQNPNTDLYKKQTGFFHSLAQNGGTIGLIAGGVLLLFVLVVIGRSVYNRRAGGNSSYRNKAEFTAELRTTLHDLEQEVGNHMTDQFELYDRFLNNLKRGGS
ncbi:MAG: PAN domain-containing protein [Nanoarchaeota archaeon]